MTAESKSTYPGTADWAKVCYAVDLTGDRLTAVRAVRQSSGIDFTSVAPDDPGLATAGADPRTVVAGSLSQQESFTSCF